MKLFAISDLHLSFANPKPMDIFGDDWKDHPEKIARNWDETVGEDDVVILAGDLSWAMRLPEAVSDLEFVADRPGRKILIRGNHDYWWSRSATNRIQKMVDSSITLLQGSSVVVDGVGIAGTRGWRLVDFTLDGVFEGEDRIFSRELDYLRKGLASIPSDVHTKIAALHYPPFDLDQSPNDFRTILEEYDVDILIYGHVHRGTGGYLEGDVEGIRYYLTSADYVNFRPVEIDITGESA